MRHNVVAYLALFFALSGSAMAAKPLIDGADVKDESLTTADIRNESLTGDDILESSLGKVSSATAADSATTAGDAATLDGKDSADFLGANHKAADADKLDGKDSTDFAGSGQSCDAGDVVTGISASGKIVCSGTDRGGGGTPSQDFCDGVDDDGDGQDGEDNPGAGTTGPNGGIIKCVDGKMVEVGGNTDEDGDTFTVEEGDCDDHDPDVHPGAPEVHDGLDNNCDGRVDEGFSGPMP